MTRLGRGDVLLALGAVLGIALAASGVAQPGRGGHAAVPHGAVATVNGTAVTVADYRRSVDAIANDRRSGATRALARRALDRLIDEELLVERGVELGLPKRDARVRTNLTGAVIDLIVARAEQSYQVPDDATLRRFHREHAYLFHAADRIRVRHLYFTGADAETRATAAAVRARGGAALSSLAASANEAPIPVPGGLLPAAKLRDYLGPSAARAALALGPHDTSEPVRAEDGYYVLQVAERTGGEARPFDSVRKLVEAEHRRRAGDLALRHFLDTRRKRAHIVVAEDRL